MHEIATALYCSSVRGVSFWHMDFCIIERDFEILECINVKRVIMRRRLEFHFGAKHSLRIVRSHS